MEINDSFDNKKKYVLKEANDDSGDVARRNGFLKTIIKAVYAYSNDDNSSSQTNYHKNETFVGPYMYVPSDCGSPYYILRPFIEAYTDHSLDHAHYNYMVKHSDAYEGRIGGIFVLQCEDVAENEEGVVLTLSDYFDSTLTLPIKGDKDIFASFANRLLIVDMEFAEYKSNSGNETRALCRNITRMPIFYNDLETFAGDEVEDKWMCSYDIVDGRIKEASEHPYRKLFPEPVRLDITNPRIRVEHYGKSITAKPEMTVESEEPDWFVNIGDTIREYVTYDGIHTTESYGAYPELKSNTYASTDKAAKNDNDTIRLSVIKICCYDSENKRIYFHCPFETNAKIYCIASSAIGATEEATLGSGYYLVLKSQTGYIEKITCSSFDADNIKIDCNGDKEGLILEVERKGNKIYDIQTAGTLYQGIIRITNGAGVHDLEAVLDFLKAYKALPIYSPIRAVSYSRPFYLTLQYLNEIFNSPHGIENTRWAHELRSFSTTEKIKAAKNILDYLLPHSSTMANQVTSDMDVADELQKEEDNNQEHSSAVLDERWALANKVMEKCKTDEEFKKEFANFIADERQWRWAIYDGVYQLLNTSGNQEETLRLSKKYPNIFGYGPKNMKLFL